MVELKKRSTTRVDQAHGCTVGDLASARMSATLRVAWDVVEVHNLSRSAALPGKRLRSTLAAQPSTRPGRGVLPELPASPGVELGGIGSAIVGDPQGEMHDLIPPTHIRTPKAWAGI